MSPANNTGTSEAPSGRTQNPNPLARVLVPLVALVLGVAFAGSFLFDGDKPDPAQDQTQDVAQTDAPSPTSENAPQTDAPAPQADTPPAPDATDPEPQAEPDADPTPAPTGERHTWQAQIAIIGDDDNRSINASIIKTPSDEVAARVAIEKNTLESEALCLDVVQDPQVQTTDWFKPFAGDPASAAKDLRDNVVSVKTERRSAILRVSATAGSADDAEKLLTRFLAIYREQRNSAGERQSEALRGFDTVIANAEARRTTAEAELTRFIQQHDIRGQESRLSEAGVELQQVSEDLSNDRAALAASQDAARALSDQIAADGNGPTPEQQQQLEAHRADIERHTSAMREKAQRQAELRNQLTNYELRLKELEALARGRDNAQETLAQARLDKERAAERLRPSGPQIVVTSPPMSVAVTPAAVANNTNPSANTPEPPTAASEPAPASRDAASDAPAFVLGPSASAEPIVIGSSDPDSQYKLELTLDPKGAGLARVAMADYNKDVKTEQPLVLFDGLDVDGPPLENQPDTFNAPTLAMFTGRGLTLDGQAAAWPAATPDATPDTYAAAQPWRLVDHGPGHATFALDVAQNGAPLARLERTYRLTPGSYDLGLEQRLVNLTTRPLKAKWAQFGNADLVSEAAAYLGDRRQVVLGYFDLANDPNRVRIHTEGTFLSRRDLAKDLAQNQDLPKAQRDPDAILWPSNEIDEDRRAQAELVWVAAESRYFAVIVHPVVPGAAQRAADIPALTAAFPSVEAVALPNTNTRGDLSPEQRSTITTLATAELALAPGATHNLDLAVYCGPRKKEVFDQAPYTLLGFEQTIRYQIPGPCAFCTFQWLAHLLLGYLKLLQGLFGDWGVAIVFLVATVRLILHPITKKAQVNMMKMGKVMQAIQPEMEKLKEKYKDDQRKLSQEMWKLQREKGIGPAGALGCLPMFLQTPIWIALYAMLYYAIELRQEPAFYGVFQAMAGWEFLADLSVADRFIPLYDESQIFKFPLLPLVFDYSSINILPLLMGVTFYINMKFTSPPPANDQQAQQQKIMKVITLLFPFFLYSAPSGLTLYIMTSTLAGIVDSYLVRKHVKKQEEAGTLLQKKTRKPGGIMDRLSKIAEAKRAQLEAMQEAAAAQQGAKGRKPSATAQPGGRATQRNLKKRKKR